MGWSWFLRRGSHLVNQGTAATLGIRGLVGLGEGAGLGHRHHHLLLLVALGLGDDDADDDAEEDHEAGRAADHSAHLLVVNQAHLDHKGRYHKIFNYAAFF